MATEMVPRSPERGGTSAGNGAADGSVAANPPPPAVAADSQPPLQGDSASLEGAGEKPRRLQEKEKEQSNWKKLIVLVEEYKLRIFVEHSTRKKEPAMEE